jgi:hypothetical protein
MSKAVVSESTTAPVRQLKTGSLLLPAEGVTTNTSEAAYCTRLRIVPDTLAGMGNVLDSAKVNIQSFF